MSWISDILMYELWYFESLFITPLNLILIVGIILLTKLAIKFLKRFFKKKEFVNKSITTIEGKEIPVWHLTKQLIWFIAIIFCIQTLYITSPNLNFSLVLKHEFFRFDKFHVAIYHFFVVTIIYFMGRFLLNMLKIYLIRRIKKRAGLDEGTEYVYLQLTKYLLITIGVILILRSFGVDLDLFLTSTAFLLVGIGLGLQDIFRDFFAGFLLLFESSIKVGDVIEIDRIEGKDSFVAHIEQINLRTSKVRTRDGKLLIIPNSQLTFQKVHNWNDEDEYTRFQIPIAVMFGQDLEIVKKILTDAAHQHPMVSKDREIFVRLLDFGENGLELDLVFWAKRSLFIEIHKSDIRFEIDRKFREHGIEYPYPQLDVHHNEKKGKQS